MQRLYKRNARSEVESPGEDNQDDLAQKEDVLDAAEILKAIMCDVVDQARQERDACLNQ